MTRRQRITGLIAPTAKPVPQLHGANARNVPWLLGAQAEARADHPFIVWVPFDLPATTITYGEFHESVRALAAAMRPGGVLHLGLKLGQGEGRDALGRFYTYYSHDALMRHLDNAGFTPFETRETLETGLAGRTDPGILILARRADG